MSRSYKKFAWGHDEVRPLTGGSNDNWGGIAMTLIDGLDTAWLLGFRKEVEAAKDTVRTVGCCERRSAPSGSRRTTSSPCSRRTSAWWAGSFLCTI